MGRNSGSGEILESVGNLGDLLRRAAAQAADAPAFRYGEELVTYREWSQWADRIGAWYWCKGLRPGSVLALLLPSTPFYLVAYLGAARLGIVTAGVNTRYRRREIGAILASSEAEVLVAIRRAPDGTDYAAVIEAQRSGLPALREVLWIDAEEFQCTATLVDRLTRGLSLPPALDVRASDPVAIVFTSGTTGFPKGACYTHRNVLAVAEIEARRYAHGFAPIRKHLAAGVSFAHLGTMVRVAVQISQLGLSIVHDRFDPERVLATVATERLPHLGAFPTQMIALLDHPRRQEYDLSCLRSVLLGGAPVSPELIHRVRSDLGATVSVRYSSTEVGIATASLPDDPPELLYDSVGRPTEGVELRIVGPDNQPLPSGAVGEVVVRSPATMVGYWKNPEATAQTIDRDGWVHTGDLGFLDEHGYLHLRGRKSEMFIRGGFNVYPLEVENVLLQHPKVAQVAVIGVPHRRWGEIGWAFVVPRRGEPPPTPEELRDFVGRELASFKRPDGLTVLDEMPVTPMFKADKRALRALWEKMANRENR